MTDSCGSSREGRGERGLWYGALSAAQQGPNGPSEPGKWLLICFGAAAFPPENDCVMLFHRRKVSVLKISRIRGAVFQ